VIQKQVPIPVAGFGTHEALNITGTGPGIAINIDSRYLKGKSEIVRSCSSRAFDFLSIYFIYQQLYSLIFNVSKN
jgi:hypothetical protein